MPLITMEDFSIITEKKVADEGLDYLQAAIATCDELSVDLELVSPLISRPLKEKIFVAARKLNFFTEHKTESLEAFIG